MPTVDQLMESQKKFKRSTYRPWNYMDEIEKEENDKQEDCSKEQEKLKEGLNQITKDRESIGNQSVEDIPSNKIDKNDSQFNNELEVEKHNFSDLENFNYPDNVEISQIMPDKQRCKDVLEGTYSLTDKIFRLSGHQKALFHFIVERCIARALLSTGPVTGETLCELMKTTSKMVKTTVQRLAWKDLVIREGGKVGRGGFYSFRITVAIRNAALEYKRQISGDHILEINKTSFGNQFDTLCKEEKNYRLPKEWEDIDIEPLKTIGFTKEHVVQLYKNGGFDPVVVQDSIHHFSFDLQFNNKSNDIKKSTAIGYFMGSIRRSGVYTAPNNYESARDRQLRLYYEKQRESADKMKEIEDKLIEIEFKKWEFTLSKDKKDKLMPDEVRNGRSSGHKLSVLKTYFVQEVWPDKRKEVLLNGAENNPNLD